MHYKSIAVYMSSSFLIVIFNKQLLTTYDFPSVAAIMFLQSILSAILFSRYAPQMPRLSLMPVCLVNVINVFFGLSAAGSLNVAMFSALRRISVLMTMLAQWGFFGRRPSNQVAVTICTMVLGAFIAAVDDLTFDLGGYAYVMVNNAFTVASQILTKNALAEGWEKETILFWTAICSTLIGAIVVATTFRPQEFQHWNSHGFWVSLGGSLLMGLAINWGAAWVIEKNDALTLSVAGSTKSAVLGLMVCFGLFDPTYQFSTINFIGLQVSTVASLFYVYFKQNDSAEEERVNKKIV